MQITTSDIKDFEGKVTIITGGSSGIGHAAALLLASHNASVVIGDLQPPPPSPNIHFIPTDVTSWSSQLALFKETLKLHGKIDIVLVNAGIDESDQPFEDKINQNGDPVEPEWRTLRVNLDGAMMTTKLALHFMRKDGRGGSIVLSGSRASYEAYNIPVYTATKHGILGMMRGLRAHTQAWNIRINMVAPSITFTPFLPSVTLEHFNRLGLYKQTPDDVALAIALLAQDSSYNGKVISVNQGVYREVEGPTREAREAVFGVEEFPKNQEEGEAMISALVTRF